MLNPFGSPKIPQRGITCKPGGLPRVPSPHKRHCERSEAISPMPGRLLHLVRNDNRQERPGRKRIPAGTVGTAAPIGTVGTVILPRVPSPVVDENRLDRTGQVVGEFGLGGNAFWQHPAYGVRTPGRIRRLPEVDLSYHR